MERDAVPRVLALALSSMPRTPQRSGGVYRLGWGGEGAEGMSGGGGVLGVGSSYQTSVRTALEHTRLRTAVMQWCWEMQ